MGGLQEMIFKGKCFLFIQVFSDMRIYQCLAGDLTSRYQISTAILKGAFNTQTIY